MNDWPSESCGRSLSENWDEESFRDEVARRLEAGEFRLVLAVEAIPDELREIVRFLNVHSVSRLEVLALELSYRRYGEVEILLPHTWGEEMVKPPGGNGELDHKTLVARTRRDHGPAAADAAEAILNWAEGDQRLDIRYTGTGGVIATADQLTLLKLWPKRAVTKGLEVSFTHSLNTASGGTTSASSSLCRTSRKSA